MDEVNHTLYISNLNDKVKKDELKTQLYALFTQYGQVVDLCVSKEKRLRGQAWIAYREVASAATALRALQNFPFYDKQLKIQFAKRDSEKITSSKERQKEKRRAAAAPSATAEGDKQGVSAAKRQQKETEEERDASRNNNSAAETRGNKTNGQESEESDEPNNILFVRGLASGTTSEHVSALLGQFGGYREARVPPARSDIAFVEFDTVVNAQAAREALDGFRVTPTCTLHIQFARK